MGLKLAREVPQAIEKERNSHSRNEQEQVCRHGPVLPLVLLDHGRKGLTKEVLEKP